MSRFFSTVIFGMMATIAIPALGQLPGLPDDDLKTARDQREDDQPEPRTIKVREDDRTITIDIKRSGAIEVKITRNYTIDEIAALKEKLPELAEAIDEVPTRAGPYKVEMTIGLSSTVKAPSLLALKEKSPRAFEYYSKYHNRRNNDSDDDRLAGGGGRARNNDDGIGDLVTRPRKKMSYEERNKKRNLPTASHTTPNKKGKERNDKDDLGDLVTEDDDKASKPKRRNRNRSDELLEDLNDRRKKDR